VKTNVLKIMAMVTLGVFMLAKCESDNSLLNNKDENGGIIKNNKELTDGNYVIDNNYLVKSTVELSEKDINRLIALDEKYAELTKGKHFLHYIINHHQIKFLTEYQHLDKISKIQKINFIHKGCFETAQIDWKEYKGLKKQLDYILEKYSPALVNDNISIINNQIATKAIEINSKDISSLYDISKFGYDDVNICADYMGKRNFTTLIRNVNRVKPDLDLDIRINEIINQYN
jgi:hypothetical protein